MRAVACLVLTWCGAALEHRTAFKRRRASDLGFQTALKHRHAIDNPDRIVSVPDLHGDYNVTVQILAAAGLIDLKTKKWIGGKAVLVQLGDIADEGDDAIDIYRLFFKLSNQAAKAGGQVVNLLGNHEVMNMQGDWRYVTKADIRSFGNAAARKKAWSATGWLGRKIRKFKTVAKVGRQLFVHAGVRPHILSNGRSLDDVNWLVERVLSKNTTAVRTKGFSAELLGLSGPFWTRFYARRPRGMCQDLKQVLEQVGVDRMIVGHSLTQNHLVKTACQGHLILTDTGIQKNGRPSFVEFDKAGNALAVYPTNHMERKLLTAATSGTSGLLRRVNFWFSHLTAGHVLNYLVLFAIVCVILLLCRAGCLRLGRPSARVVDGASK